MATVEVDVDLSYFDDDEILEAAISIVEERRGKGGEYAKLFGRLADALSSRDEDVEELPTSARLSNISELRELVEKHPELYRFAA